MTLVTLDIADADMSIMAVRITCTSIAIRIRRRCRISLVSRVITVTAVTVKSGAVCPQLVRVVVSYRGCIKVTVAVTEIRSTAGYVDGIVDVVGCCADRGVA